jgi:hypothetical protein
MIAVSKGNNILDLFAADDAHKPHKCDAGTRLVQK